MEQEAQVALKSERRTTVNVTADISDLLDAEWTHHNSWLLAKGMKKLPKWVFAGLVIRDGIANIASQRNIQN